MGKKRKHKNKYRGSLLSQWDSYHGIQDIYYASSSQKDVKKIALQVFGSLTVSAEDLK